MTRSLKEAIEANRARQQAKRVVTTGYTYVGDEETIARKVEDMRGGTWRPTPCGSQGYRCGCCTACKLNSTPKSDARND